MIDSLPPKVKLALQGLLKKIEGWEKAGHLSPRLWGGLLATGVLAVILLAQNNLIFRPGPPLPPTALPSVTPQPVLARIKDGLLSEVEALATLEAAPLQATVTPVALLAPVTPLPATPSPSPEPPFIFHTIQGGETLISIAAEYGVTSEALLAANDIRDPTNLQIGQSLLIPPHDGFRMPVVLHTIEPGDKLLSLATKYGSSVKDILAANPGLVPGSLAAGRAIAVPIIFSQVKPTPQREESSEEAYYIVQRGDIPLTIAAEFDVPVELLLTANDITNPTRLQVGQRLLIPSHEGITLGFPVVLHELLESDTLLGLATRYGSSVKDILAVNPDLVPSSLQPGDLVAVPVIFRQPRPTPEPDAVPAAPIEVSAPLVDLQQQMIEAVNAERQAQGLPPYLADEQLTRIAAAYAQDMVARDFFSHVSPEGQTLRDRFTGQGVTDALRVGENIQRNTRPLTETVQTALTWFMGSRPHRHNILHPNHNRIGVGIVEGPPGWYTFVLDFAQR